MAELNRLTALILAGGLGTRLRGALADLPKVLAPVAGRPFLAYLLEQVQSAGIRRAVLCTGYRAAQVRAAFGDRYGDIELRYSEEWEPLGTGGALRLAAAGLDTEDVLVMNGDSWFEADLEGFLERHRVLQVESSLLLTRVPDVSRYGQVRADQNGLIVSFEEKGSSQGAGWINAGVYLTTRRALTDIPAGRVVSLEREIFPLWVARKLGGICQEGRFIDIGTPESFTAAQVFFAQTCTLPAGNVQAATNGPAALRRYALLDRDGTVIVKHPYLAEAEKVALLPGAGEALRLLRSLGYGLLIVTNQSALGRGLLSTEELERIHARMTALLAPEGVTLDGIYVCPHTPEDACDCRKPKPGLADRAAQELDFKHKNCVVIGDNRCDVELGKAIGAMTILVRTGEGSQVEGAGECTPDRIEDDLLGAARYLALQESQSMEVSA